MTVTIQNQKQLRVWTYRVNHCLLYIFTKCHMPGMRPQRTQRWKWVPVSRPRPFLFVLLLLLCQDWPNSRLFGKTTPRTLNRRGEERPYHADAGLEIGRDRQAAEDDVLRVVVEIHLIQLQDWRWELLKAIREPIGGARVECAGSQKCQLPSAPRLSTHFNTTSDSLSTGFSSGLRGETEKGLF